MRGLRVRSEGDSDRHAAIASWRVGAVIVRRKDLVGVATGDKGSV